MLAHIVGKPLGQILVVECVAVERVINNIAPLALIQHHRAQSENARALLGVADVVRIDTGLVAVCVRVV